MGRPNHDNVKSVGPTVSAIKILRVLVSVGSDGVAAVMAQTLSHVRAAMFDELLPEVSPEAALKGARCVLSADHLVSDNLI